MYHACIKHVPGLFLACSLLVPYVYCACIQYVPSLFLSCSLLVPFVYYACTCLVPGSSRRSRPRSRDLTRTSLDVTTMSSSTPFCLPRHWGLTYGEEWWPLNLRKESNALPHPWHTSADRDSDSPVAWAGPARRGPARGLRLGVTPFHTVPTARGRPGPRGSMLATWSSVSNTRVFKL